PIDNPRLTSDFCRHPSCSIGDIGKWKTQQQWPQSPARMKEPSPPQQKSRNHHQENEICPQSSHDVVAVKQKGEGGGPLVVGNLVKSLNFRPRSPINQKAEHVIYNQWIVNGLLLFIGLSHQNNGGTLLGSKQPFHSRNRSRLFLRHVTAMQVAGGKDLRNA